MLKASILLPQGNGKFPDPILVNDYEDIQREVGGLFTTIAYRGEVSGEKIDLIGFVPDEIHEHTHDTINWYASALFEQEVHGPCVLAWGLSPNGESDGDIYDMPDTFSQFIFGSFTDAVVRAYGTSYMMSAMFESAVAEGVISEDELEKIMEALEAMNNGTFDEYTQAQRLDFMLLLNTVEGYVLRKEGEKDDQ